MGKRKLHGMAFYQCEWTDADVHQLAAALKYAHAAEATTQADILILGNNRLTAAALPPLVEAIAAGAMPKLKGLYLFDNDGLGDVGAKVLAAALSEGRLPTLEVLDLRYTGMGDAGATALARSLGGAPALEMLLVGDDDIGEAAKEELKAACAKGGVRAMADMDNEL